MDGGAGDEGIEKDDMLFCGATIKSKAGSTL